MCFSSNSLKIAKLMFIPDIKIFSSPSFSGFCFAKRVAKGYRLFVGKKIKKPDLYIRLSAS
jgi:hypothetical protein